MGMNHGIGSRLPGLLHQSSFQIDRRGCECFGDRTVRFGLLRNALKGCFVDAWYDGLCLQVDGTDLKALLYGMQVNTSCGMHSGRRETRASEAGGERHGVAPGVRGTDEFFRVRATCAIAHT